MWLQYTEAAAFALVGTAACATGALLASGYKRFRRACVVSSGISAAWLVAHPIVVLHGLSMCVHTTLPVNNAVLDCSVEFPASATFETAYDKLRAEVLAIPATLPKNTRDTYGGNNAYIGSDVTQHNESWRIFTVAVHSTVSTAAAKLTPTLAQLVRDDDDVVSCVVSILPARAKIPAHTGYYKGVVRYMLALKVPQQHEECFLVVDSRKIVWEEGKSVCFDDTFVHYVENNTNEPRIVVYMDIVRRNAPNPIKALTRAVSYLMTHHPAVQRELA